VQTLQSQPSMGIPTLVAVPNKMNSNGKPLAPLDMRFNAMRLVASV